jgi:hypothetical protein
LQGIDQLLDRHERAGALAAATRKLRLP